MSEYANATAETRRSSWAKEPFHPVLHRAQLINRKFVGRMADVLLLSPVSFRGRVVLAHLLPFLSALKCPSPWSSRRLTLLVVPGAVHASLLALLSTGANPSGVRGVRLVQRRGQILDAAKDRLLHLLGCLRAGEIVQLAFALLDVLMAIVDDVAQGCAQLSEKAAEIQRGVLGDGRCLLDDVANQDVQWRGGRRVELNRERVGAHERCAALTSASSGDF